MSKKKALVRAVQPLSPENYIKTRARTLPLGKCYALEDWAETGMSFVLVTRVHVTGNLTFGAYLVDLLCLGIKDTFCNFNQHPEQIEELVEEKNLVEIDYLTAHNMIYGAEAFAAEYGFKPEQGWKLSQYILEPDAENIPLLDIEFGRDGMPFYVPGPFEDKPAIDRVVGILERNAGTGNFKVVFPQSEYDDEFNDEFDDEFDEDEEDSLFPPGELEGVLSGEQEGTLHQKYALCVAVLAAKGMLTAQSSVDIDILREEVDSLVDYTKYYCIDHDLDDLIDDFRTEYEEVLEKTTPEAIDDFRKLREENPTNPYIYFREFVYYNQYGLSAEMDEIKLLVKEMFPDFLFFDFVAAIAASEKDKPEETTDWLKSYYLMNAFPHRDSFSWGEHLHFCAAWCEYFTRKGMISEAITYANQIVEDTDTSDFVQNAIIRLCLAMGNEVVESDEAE